MGRGRVCDPSWLWSTEVQGRKVFLNKEVRDAVLNQDAQRSDCKSFCSQTRSKTDFVILSCIAGCCRLAEVRGRCARLGWLILRGC